jgi:hypothetical protein
MILQPFLYSNFGCLSFVHLDPSGGIGARPSRVIEQGRKSLFPA